MKKLLALGCLILLGPWTAAANWNQAENLYRQGKYAAALAAYEDLLQTYPNDPYLYYNIGNSYFKMGSKGLAVANYYRAFERAPRDKDLRHNLALALAAGGERLVPAGMPAALHQVFFGLTVSELKGLFFLMCWLCCTLGSVWLVKRRGGKAALLSLLLALGVGGFYAWRAALQNQPLAVVAAPVAELRSGPGEQFPAQANVAQGRLLLVQDTKDQWSEVVVKSQGIKGWMESSSLEKI